MTEKNGQFTPGFGTMRFGCDFFPDARPNPDQLISDLMEGTSVKVFGLRRIGKSSLLAETRDRLQSMGKNVIWVNLEKHDTLAKALEVILNSLHQGSNRGIFARVRSWLDSSKIVPAIFKSSADALVSAAVDKYSKDYDIKYIETLSDQVSRLLEAQNPDAKPIIIFDELTTLIKRTIGNSKDGETAKVVERLNSFLGLLRHLRTPDAGIAMAVSGSVSIDWLKEVYGVRSESVNDCINRNIEELDRDGARKLLEMCLDAKSLPNWNEKLTEDLLDHLPAYYSGIVQLAFDVINTETTPVAALDNSIRYKINMKLWEYYYEQLDDFYQQFSDSEQSRISKLFDVLATKENDVIDFNEALGILNGADLEKDELNGRAILRRLKARSFIDIAASSGIRFSSGLVSGWYNSEKKKAS